MDSHERGAGRYPNGLIGRRIIRNFAHQFEAKEAETPD